MNHFADVGNMMVFLGFVFLYLIRDFARGLFAFFYLLIGSISSNIGAFFILYLIVVCDYLNVLSRFATCFFILPLIP